MPSKYRTGRLAVLETGGRKATHETHLLRMYGVLVTLLPHSSASAAVSSATLGSNIASSSCKTFPAPVSEMGFSPPPVSCGEGQAVYSYGMSVCTICPIS